MPFGCPLLTACAQLKPLVTPTYVTGSATLISSGQAPRLCSVTLRSRCSSSRQPQKCAGDARGEHIMYQVGVHSQMPPGVPTVPTALGFAVGSHGQLVAAVEHRRLRRFGPANRRHQRSAECRQQGTLTACRERVKEIQLAVNRNNGCERDRFRNRLLNEPVSDFTLWVLPISQDGVAGDTSDTSFAVQGAG